MAIKKEKPMILEANIFTKSVIPTEVMDLFINFLKTSNVKTEQYFDVDELSGQRILTKEKVTTQQQDLKASLSFFERVYPQYFDPIAQEKLEQMKANNGDSSADEMKKIAREIFSDGD